MGIVSEMVEDAMDEAGDTDEIENNVSFFPGNGNNYFCRMLML